MYTLTYMHNKPKTLLWSISCLYHLYISPSKTWRLRSQNWPPHGHLAMDLILTFQKCYTQAFESSHISWPLRPLPLTSRESTKSAHVTVYSIWWSIWSCLPLEIRYALLMRTITKITSAAASTPLTRCENIYSLMADASSQIFPVFCSTVELMAANPWFCWVSIFNVA